MLLRVRRQRQSVPLPRFRQPRVAPNPPELVVLRLPVPAEEEPLAPAPLPRVAACARQELSDPPRHVAPDVVVDQLRPVLDALDVAVVLLNVFLVLPHQTPFLGARNRLIRGRKPLHIFHVLCHVFRSPARPSVLPRELHFRILDHRVQRRHLDEDHGDFPELLELRVHLRSALAGGVGRVENRHARAGLPDGQKLFHVVQGVQKHAPPQRHQLPVAVIEQVRVVAVPFRAGPLVAFAVHRFRPCAPLRPRVEHLAIQAVEEAKVLGRAVGDGRLAAPRHPHHDHAGRLNTSCELVGNRGVTVDLSLWRWSYVFTSAICIAVGSCFSSNVTIGNFSRF
mmetsp:Transcript_81677/g.159456  ORF Transcript_81677/g.159456 Transcript_81677/m.159456 type:complete len:338 (-) Transcript_81677:210-1223(-)